MPSPIDAGSLPPVTAAARAASEGLSAAGITVSLSDEDRLAYSRDMWPKAMLWMRQGKIPQPPDVIVWPRDEAEVLAVVEAARRHELPLIPFGAGSGVCGGTLAVRGGLMLDVKRLEQIGTVDPNLLTVDVGAGVMGEVLERELDRQGYTLGHFPSSIYMSTVGGWLAARSAGQLSGKYGKIEDMVASVRAVSGRAELMVTPERPHPGPDLAQLLIGSEGTLCAFTGARLRVHPKPAQRAFRGFRFKDVDTGLEAIRRLYQAGLRPAVTRLYDPFDTALVGKGKKPHEPPVPPSERGLFRQELLPGMLRRFTPKAFARPSLLNRVADVWRQSLLVVMYEGAEGRTASEEAQGRAICREVGGVDLGEEPGRRWYANRYAVSYKMSKVFDAGMFVDTMEVATTWDKVTVVYEAVREAVGPIAFVLCHFSHAYLEGCSLYFSFAASADGDAAQEARYDALWTVALGAAVGAGATVSHHHGIGLLKEDMLREELGEGRRLLAGLKVALDPDGIMNPGKMTL